MTAKRKAGSATPGGDSGRCSVAITRREFVAIAGATLSSSVLPTSLTACQPGAGPPGPTPGFTVTLMRPTDLLYLKIGFVNLALSSDGTMIQPVSSGSPGYLQVDFGPQHVLEQRFFSGSSTPPTAGAPVQTLIAGNTRVVFVVPPGQSLEYSVTSLLTAFATSRYERSRDCDAGRRRGQAHVPASLADRTNSAEELRRSRGPRSRGRRTSHHPIVVLDPAPPTSVETALELPTRLMLAPNQYAGWAHAFAEVTSASQRTELTAYAPGGSRR